MFCFHQIEKYSPKSNAQNLATVLFYKLKSPQNDLTNDHYSATKFHLQNMNTAVPKQRRNTRDRTITVEQTIFRNGTPQNWVNSDALENKIGFKANFSMTYVSLKQRTRVSGT